MRFAERLPKGAAQDPHLELVEADLLSLSDEDLLRRTTSLGLDRSLLQTCLASDRHDKAILESSQDGAKLGVQSTPTFFINGRRMRGARDPSQFQEIIDSELKAGG